MTSPWTQEQVLKTLQQPGRYVDAHALIQESTGTVQSVLKATIRDYWGPDVQEEVPADLVGTMLQSDLIVLDEAPLSVDLTETPDLVRGYVSLTTPEKQGRMDPPVVPWVSLQGLSDGATLGEWVLAPATEKDRQVLLSRLKGEIDVLLERLSAETPVILVQPLQFGRDAGSIIHLLSKGKAVCDQQDSPVQPLKRGGVSFHDVCVDCLRRWVDAQTRSV